jgi:hypothetical protein
MTISPAPGRAGPLEHAVTAFHNFLSRVADQGWVDVGGQVGQQYVPAVSVACRNVNTGSRLTCAGTGHCVLEDPPPATAAHPTSCAENGASASRR